jgi:exonuclease III
VERRGVFHFLIKPKILRWNVRELNEWDTGLWVRNLLIEWKVDIVCFQETKWEVMSWRVVRSLWGCHHL